MWTVHRSSPIPINTCFLSIYLSIPARLLPVTWGSYQSRLMIDLLFSLHTNICFKSFAIFLFGVSLKMNLKIYLWTLSQRWLIGTCQHFSNFWQFFQPFRNFFHSGRTQRGQFDFLGNSRTKFCQKILPRRERLRQLLLQLRHWLQDPWYPNPGSNDEQ